MTTNGHIKEGISSEIKQVVGILQQFTPEVLTPALIECGFIVSRLPGFQVKRIVSADFEDKCWTYAPLGGGCFQWTSAVSLSGECEIVLKSTDGKRFSYLYPAGTVVTVCGDVIVLPPGARISTIV